MGLHITRVEQFLSVLDSIQQKLAFWSNAKLSLAGQALVVNQVLLTTWDVALC